ncbi:ras-specific guanine nucleotide-releasing factor 2-like isoform X2 [Sycon ciliatum]|uniref:ras-specific guanine nucleotide-releasing factor 2-like isoform X2 n=1 Tax=Sycon ciliatum TaxID=27933 RepID=UPI0020ABC4B7
MQRNGEVVANGRPGSELPPSLENGPGSRLRSHTCETGTFDKEAIADEEKKRKKPKKRSQKRTVKAAALETLFLQLGEERFQAGDFLYTFLTTYRYFTRSGEVIKALQSVYRQQRQNLQFAQAPSQDDAVFSFADPPTSSGGMSLSTDNLSRASGPRGSSGSYDLTAASPSLQSDDSLNEDGPLNGDAKKDDSDIFRPRARLYQGTVSRPGRTRRKMFCSLKNEEHKSEPRLSVDSPGHDSQEEDYDGVLAAKSCPTTLDSINMEKVVFLERTMSDTPPTDVPLCDQLLAHSTIGNSDLVSSTAGRMGLQRSQEAVDDEYSEARLKLRVSSVCGATSPIVSRKGGLKSRSYTSLVPLAKGDSKEDYSQPKARWPSLPAIIRRMDNPLSSKSSKEHLPARAPATITSDFPSPVIVAKPLRPTVSGGADKSQSETWAKTRRSMPMVGCFDSAGNGIESASSSGVLTEHHKSSTDVSRAPPRSETSGPASVDRLHSRPGSDCRDAGSAGHSRSPSPSLPRAPVSQPRDQKCSPLTLRVFNILKQWIKTFPDDFNEKSMSRHLILQFIEEVKQSSIMADVALAKNLNKCLLQASSAAELGSPTDKAALSMSAFSNGKGPKLSTFSHQCVAEQMTLSTHQAFCRIRPGELCKQAWKRQNRREIAPNVCAVIDKCNRLGNWVPSEILAGKTAAKRADAIEKIIRIAFHCLDLHNLNDTLIIAYSLQNSAVERLSKSWKLVPSKVMKMLEDIKKVCSANERYQAMRTYIHACEPPCVPFIGAYLDMIYGIDVTMNTFDNNGFVNFAKMVRLSKQIRELVQFQQEQYKELEFDLVTQHYLSTGLVLEDDDEIFTLSLEREPREAQKTMDNVTNSESSTSIFN